LDFFQSVVLTQLSIKWIIKLAILISICIFSSLSSSPNKPHDLAFSVGPQDSLLLCDSIRDYCQPSPASTMSPFLASPTCSEEDGSSSSDLMSALRDQLEETYTSSLFQTEPLYQFYDNDMNEVKLDNLNYNWQINFGLVSLWLFQNQL
jgi:hypothetical protein